jgi:probable rRNA maturation factor
VRAHFAHLVVHGALHLAGHDHERGRDAAIMESVERRILARLGFADPYRSG